MRRASRRRRYQVLRAYTRVHAPTSSLPNVLPSTSLHTQTRTHIFTHSLTHSLRSLARYLSSLVGPRSLRLLRFLPSFSSPSFASPFPSSIRFSRSRWVDRSQHRPIRALLRIPTRIPDLLRHCGRGCRGREQAEPDLSPLNGINKLYYACTSP